MCSQGSFQVGEDVPVVKTRATEEAGVARCAEGISRRTGTGARTEPAPLGCVAPRHTRVAGACIWVEALVHFACGVAQPPAAGLDWHVGQCDTGDRAVHESGVARDTLTARCVGLEEVARDAAALIGRGGPSKVCGREL